MIYSNSSIPPASYNLQLLGALLTKFTTVEQEPLRISGYVTVKTVHQYTLYTS